MKTEKFTNIFIILNVILFSIMFGYFLHSDLIHKKVDYIGYTTPDKTFVEKIVKNDKDVYYIKLYKDKIGKNRYKFNKIEVSEKLENDFIHINDCNFKRFTVLTDDGFVNLKVRDQNPYERVYVTIPKDEMYIIVSDYLLTVEVTDTKRLASLLSTYKRLSLKPIEIRIWLNLRNKEMNPFLLYGINMDLKEVGLKITEYREL